MGDVRYLAFNTCTTRSVIWIMFPSITSWMIGSAMLRLKRPILNSTQEKYRRGFLANSNRAAFFSLPSSVIKPRFSSTLCVDELYSLLSMRSAAMPLSRKYFMALRSKSLIVACSLGISSQERLIFFKTNCCKAEPFNSCIVLPLRQ